MGCEDHKKSIPETSEPALLDKFNIDRFKDEGCAISSQGIASPQSKKEKSTVYFELLFGRRSFSTPFEVPIQEPSILVESGY
jgi:hypothetical protein